MENTETIGNLELLVKLASFGAAGISILAIFIIGTRIFNLPNDTSPVKASVLKFFMTTCIFMTTVCGVSGIANAYFNRNKIEQANENFEKLGIAYKNEVKMVEEEKKEIETTLVDLKRQLRNVSNLPTEVTTTINKAETGVKQIQMRPYEVINKNIKSTQTIRKRLE